jgi:hypothetical protein
VFVGAIGSDHHRGTLVALADNLEQQVGANFERWGLQMRRREFIAGLGSAAASLSPLPLAVRGEQPALRLISTPLETYSDDLAAFRCGLAEKLLTGPRHANAGIFGGVRLRGYAPGFI